MLGDPKAVTTTSTTTSVRTAKIEGALPINRETVVRWAGTDRDATCRVITTCPVVDVICLVAVICRDGT